MIRDEEIKRLEQYAKGLGLKVEYRRSKPGHGVGAEVVSIDGISVILVLYMWPGISKKLIVLNFLHELGHHLSWIYKNRKDDPKLLKALVAEDERKPGDSPIPKRMRKLIYEMEKQDAEYRMFVAHEVGVKLSAEVIREDIELDVWFYHEYYVRGDYPSQLEVLAKRKEIKQRGKLAKET